MTLPTDPTSGAGGTDTHHPSHTSHTFGTGPGQLAGELAGIRELILVLRDLVDRLEDRIEHLAEGKG